MNNKASKLAQKIRPDLETLSGQQQISATADVLTLLYMFPLAVLGLLWLVAVSNLDSILQFWRFYLLMGAILIIFNRLRFFFITEIRTGGYANSDGTMDGLAVWVAILLLGPTALWLKVIWNILIYSTYIYRERSTQSYWNRARMLSADLASDLLATLIALVAYRAVGGVIPIRDYSMSSIAPALLAVIIQFIGMFIVYSGYITYVIWSLKNVLHTPSQPAISFFWMAISLPALANPFGILAAGIYVREGLPEFLYMMIGLLLVAFLARRLSQAAEYSRP